MIKPERIINAVERFYELPAGSLKGHSRKARTTRARRLAVGLLRDWCGFSYSEIAERLNKHHTSIIYLYNKKPSYWKFYLWQLINR